MNIEGRTVLITGANRGIGRALVDEALRRGAKRVYAGTRQPISHSDPRVTPLKLDVTDNAQIKRAAEKVEALDILVNNAGVAPFDDLTGREALDQALAVNLFGTRSMVDAFLPLLTRSQGTIVNVLSMASIAPVPVVPAYSASKAAAFSLTQSMRMLLSPQGIHVHAAMPGPVDTDMSRGIDAPKASAEDVARAIFDGMERGEDEIFPDPMSAMIAENWRTGAAKTLESQFAAFAKGN